MVMKLKGGVRGYSPNPSMEARLISHDFGISLWCWYWFIKNHKTS